MIKRTPEGLKWPIDSKIEYDLRDWPKKVKTQSTRKKGVFKSENKPRPSNQRLQGKRA